MPAAFLERQPLGVIFMLSALISSGMPGVSLSITAFVASGVMSRGANPVPPVVSTNATFSSSAHFVSSSFIISISSGTIEVYTTSIPFSFSIPQSAGPLVSTLSPFEPLSLTVITAALYAIIDPLSFYASLYFANQPVKFFLLRMCVTTQE